jgi:hypothetical protein
MADIVNIIFLAHSLVYGRIKFLNRNEKNHLECNTGFNLMLPEYISTGKEMDT